MKYAERFGQKFAVSIIATPSCFDRVIFKGYLPFGSESRLNAFVDGVLKMRRKDFLPWLQQHSQALVDHARRLARRHGRRDVYRQGRFSKEQFIQRLIRQQGLSEGLVAVLCVQENCRTVKLKYERHRPRLVFTRRWRVTPPRPPVARCDRPAPRSWTLHRRPAKHARAGRASYRVRLCRGSTPKPGVSFRGR